MSADIPIGFNWRMFDDIWRPVAEDIEFALTHGFEAIQFLDRGRGFSSQHFGDSVAAVGRTLQRSGLTAVMEINVILTSAAKVKGGGSLIETLKRNLSVIESFGCQHVHWHLNCFDLMDREMLLALEASLISECQQAVKIANQYGFQFGVEHNAREVPLLVDVDHCKQLLNAVPGLGLVWDLNHTKPQQLQDFQALAPNITMLHVSDTPVPESNHHLPLGEGNIDFGKYLRPVVQQGINGPAILEIGGVPHHGGAGRDSDEALLRSQQYLQKALST